MFAKLADDLINLRTDRISVLDGERQMRTAAEILERFARQPGVILADGVGMGKTFVAMAVAASTIAAHPELGPVVVMVPSTLREKWPKDWSVFCEKCLAPEARKWVRHGEADSGLEFLRLLDDPPERRVHIIFLTHGSLHRALSDGFVKLAVIKHVFQSRRSLSRQRRSFHRFAGKLLHIDYIERKAEGLLGRLLERPYGTWLRTIQRAHEDFRQEYTDDPVPAHFVKALELLSREHIDALADELSGVPLRRSANLDERLTKVRQQLAVAMKAVWKDALQKANFRSPLLILDEAHHVKNPATRLASLFIDDEAAAESEVFESGGALGGKFYRMLFLTATPFQLGHQELINILSRFEGIHWNSEVKPHVDRAGFKQEIGQLAQALDDSQASALRLEQAWGKLQSEHFVDDEGGVLEPDTWWERAEVTTDEGVLGQVVTQVGATRRAIKTAEVLLRPWVIRSVKERMLLPGLSVNRREMLTGSAILEEGNSGSGLEIEDAMLLPFLLAGRAQMILAAHSQGRALFAEGLSSSFEAYFETRERRRERLDEDLEEDDVSNLPAGVAWYLEHLDSSLKAEGRGLADRHPKIRATAERVLQLWRSGEKVLVFCHYRATGRALRQHISALINEEILRRGKEMLPERSEADVGEEFERIGNRLDREGRVRHRVEAALYRIADKYQEKLLPDQRKHVVEVMRRFIRTPSFLARYIDVSRSDIAAAFEQALDADVGGLSLRGQLDAFCQFLSERCIALEREQYLDALETIQTGTIYGAEVLKVFDPAEQRRSRIQERALLLPNVRLANGEVSQDTRRKLLLAFNTPLFPEVLVASSVLSEGVDLHLNCRYVIHHDLCWNPSTIEQRTGRLDRLGCKAEQVTNPIHVYLPYIAATQDEKMFRVVRDRERWFHVVMGDKFEIDEASTERIAERVPLPDNVLADLTLRLEPDAPAPDKDRYIPQRYLQNRSRSS